MTSPKVIFNAIFPVPVKILNSYKVTQEESDTFRKSLGLDLRKVLLLKNVLKNRKPEERERQVRKETVWKNLMKVLPVYTICSWITLIIRHGVRICPACVKNLEKKTD